MLACQVGGCSKGLSSEAISLIVVASIIVLIAIAYIIYKVINKKK